MLNIGSIVLYSEDLVLGVGGGFVLGEGITSLSLAAVAGGHASLVVNAAQTTRSNASIDVGPFLTQQHDLEHVIQERLIKTPSITHRSAVGAILWFGVTVVQYAEETWTTHLQLLGFRIRILTTDTLQDGQKVDGHAGICFGDRRAPPGVP